MIYFHTDNAREIFREHVKNLAEWVELFLKDLSIKKGKYEVWAQKLPEICYLGENQYLNIVKFNKLIIYNRLEEHWVVKDLRIIRVNKKNYLEVG